MRNNYLQNTQKFSKYKNQLKGYSKLVVNTKSTLTNIRIWPWVSVNSYGIQRYEMHRNRQDLIMIITKQGTNIQIIVS